jgi:hypothetical protein
MEECGPCPVFASFTLAFALQLRKKHGKTSVRVRKTSVRLRKTSVRVQYTYYQNTCTWYVCRKPLCSAGHDRPCALKYIRELRTTWICMYMYIDGV